MKIRPIELQQRYTAGENIIALLKAELDINQNTSDMIEIAYDLQTGSYTNAMANPETQDFMGRYSAAIAREILALCVPETVLEAGVGEATTLSGVLTNLPLTTKGYGFDISWSRVACGIDWLKTQNVHNAKLCTGDLFNIPFADNSIDVVYTSHSIEPNGGNELPILRELYRVAKKYLVLLEPGYELAPADARRRMEECGYCRNLTAIAKQLGYLVQRYELFPLTINPLNPTSIIVISKAAVADNPDTLLACPKYKTQLQRFDNAYYSEEALVAYPILGGVPCLRVENGIMASHFARLVRRAHP